MAIAELKDWMDEQSAPGVVWYIKRLAANDTLATGGHQAGPYMPKEFLFSVFPSLHRPDLENPDKCFEIQIDSHHDVRNVRAIWYNNELRGGTRNETRITRFGGSASAVLDPDNTGALVVFAFHRGDQHEDANVCHVWVCEHDVEADVIEERLGPVEPGRFLLWSVDRQDHSAQEQIPAVATCWLQPDEIPRHWFTKFPSGAEVVQKAVERRPERGADPDRRLMKRRECEFQIFRSLEHAIELPAILTGFSTIDDFIARAQILLQRRKSRSGRSLELHAQKIFLEEGLIEARDFQYQPESEAGKRPDFLFPNQAAYQDSNFPAERLRMLAVKTTCRERWRQILPEADRVQRKHLLTLQQGVSANQFQELVAAKVQLVVPEPLFRAYPPAIRPYLQTLESFIAEVRHLNLR